MKRWVGLSVLGGLTLPGSALAHVTGAAHLHAEQGAAWMIGLALILGASGVALRRVWVERRR